MSYPNLAAEMKRAGIGPEELAPAIKKSPDTVRNWMKGKGEPTIGAAFTIQERFFPSMPIAYLFARTPIVMSEQRAV